MYRLCICLSVCLLFHITTVHAAQDAYTLYVMEDRRYDSQQDDEEIAAGVFKQLMAALLLIENTQDFDKELLVVYDYENPAYQAEITYELGDQLTVTDAYHVLLMEPAEDLYIATAVYMEKTEQDMLKSMNEKAALMGMDATHFDYADHSVTTIHDLQILLQACWDNEILQKAMIKQAYTDSRGRKFINHTMKDTPADGLCYAVTDKRSPIAAIIENEKGHFMYLDDVDSETDWNHFLKATEDYRIQKIENTDSFPKELEVTGNLFQSSIPIDMAGLEVTVRDEIDISDIHAEIVQKEIPQAPISHGDTLGQLKVYENDKLLKIIPLTAKDSILPLNRYLFMLFICFSLCFIEYKHRKKDRHGKQ